MNFFFSNLLVSFPFFSHSSYSFQYWIFEVFFCSSTFQPSPHLSFRLENSLPLFASGFSSSLPLTLLLLHLLFPSLSLSYSHGFLFLYPLQLPSLSLFLSSSLLSLSSNIFSLICNLFSSFFITYPLSILFFDRFFSIFNFHFQFSCSFAFSNL